MSDPFLINGSGGALDRLGVIAAEQVWELDNEPDCLTYTVDHPLGIPILERQWRQQAHGKWHVTLKFEGVSDVSAADGKEDYEGDSGDAEDPIETHPMIDWLTQHFTRQADNGDGRIVWTQTMADKSGKSVRNPMFGYESYKVSQPTWTQHKLYARLPNDLYSNVDKFFANPPGPVPPIMPNTDWWDISVRNWLLCRVVPRKRGNIWQVSSTWMLSGEGGWSKFLYLEAPQ